MVNRILIRIKVVQILYSYFNGDKDLATAEKELFFSLEKAYELYHYLLVLMVELTDLQGQRIEAAKSKYMPTHEDLNPNMRFVENRFIAALRQHPSFDEYISTQKLTWVNEPELMKQLLDKVVASPLYDAYMHAKEDSFEADKQFWRAIFKQVICSNEFLIEKLEEQSLYWNDDLDTVGTFVIKTIKKFTPEQFELQPMYSHEDDETFARQLFRKAVLNESQYKKYIEQYARNWDIDRLAFMDIVIMVTALAEITTFESIPVKVSLNEYIELAKCYSTPRSGRFINGILDGIVDHLKKNGQLTKV